MTPFKFQKSVQLLNFFAIKEGGSLNKLKALKLMWAAERLSLRTSGLTIVGDDFFAMKLGPVPSFTKDIAEGREMMSDEEQEFRSLYLKTTSKHNFKSLKSFEDSYFSISAINAMEASYKEFGKYDGFQMADITHLYPEWTKFSHLFPRFSRFEMDYLDFFKDPTEQPFSIFNQDKEQLEFMKDHFIEESNFNNIMFSI
ncbi:Panacea domain-containing protein [Pedobacter lithocola]|uniref:Panacea domain-containing protein n=1 Tax=Pedobacter lithocola TaxID=1908239 RepID=A0ABV8PB15_9SPHI